MMMRPSVNIASVCDRILPSNDDIFKEHVPNYTRVLPSNNEACSEHVFDSMDRCTVDELVKRDLRRFATWWKKQNEDVF